MFLCPCRQMDRSETAQKQAPTLWVALERWIDLPDMADVMLACGLPLVRIDCLLQQKAAEYHYAICMPCCWAMFRSLQRDVVFETSLGTCRCCNTR